MSTKRVTLGRGLSALLGEETTTNLGRPNTVSINSLVRGKYQPREKFQEESLAELASSIKSQGIIQPIVVRPITASQYEIIAGERRFRAAKQAGLTEVPVVIKEINDQSALAIALIENLQREDITAIEEAKSINRLIDEFDLTHQQAADCVGKNRATISNLLRLLSLSNTVQEYMASGKLDMGHGRALLSLEESDQLVLAEQVIKRNLTARQTEALVSNYHKPKQVKSQPEELVNLSNRISSSLNIKADIKASNAHKGRIILHYNSEKDLELIISNLLSNTN